MTPDSPAHSPYEESLEEGPDLGSATEDSAQEYDAEPYNPAQTRENYRGRIALILIGLMAVLVLASFVLFWIHPDRIDKLQAFFGFVFGPIVALVGAATGYYFGSQEANKS